MEDCTSLQHVVVSAQHGDEHAWKQLYQACYPYLYATALRICGASPETRDLVQDTFLSAFLHLPQLKDPLCFRLWIRKILERNCYHYLRNKHQAERIQHLPAGCDADAAALLEYRNETAWKHQHLHWVLASISAGLRSVVLLRYFSNLRTYKSIADVLSIPLGTVRSRLNEANSQLAKKWNQPAGYPRDDEESNAWNQFYFSSYTGLHYSDTERKRFLAHLGSEVQLVFPGGKRSKGSSAFETLIADDQKHGSWLKPVEVISCGDISIIEALHFNSAEYPDHCPQKSIAVVFREGDRVKRLHLQPCRD